MFASVRFCLSAIVLLAGALRVGVAPVLAQEYLAFSLSQASRQAEQGDRDVQVRQLGGITRVIGVVYDEKQRDMVLVGAVVKGLPEIFLDDLVAALRSRIVGDIWPQVSIDYSASLAKARKLSVRFEGGPAKDSSFALGFFNADLALKGYSLGLLRAVEGVKSYRQRRIDAAAGDVHHSENLPKSRCLLPTEAPRETSKLASRPVQSEDNYQYKFWFTPEVPFDFDKGAGVFCINSLKIIVEKELVRLSGTRNVPAPSSGASVTVESASKEFAKEFGARSHTSWEELPGHRKAEGALRSACCGGGDPCDGQRCGSELPSAPLQVG